VVTSRLYCAGPPFEPLSQTWSALAAELDLEAEHEDEPEQPQPENHFETVSDAMSLRQSLVFFLSVGLPALLLIYLVLQHWPDR